MAAPASKTLIACLFGLALADVGAILARVVAAHGGGAAPTFEPPLRGGQSAGVRRTRQGGV